MFIRAKGVSSIDMALYKDRLSEYQELTKALSHMQQINENDQEAHEKLVLSQLKTLRSRFSAMHRCPKNFPQTL